MSIRKGDDVIAGASVGFIGKPAWSQAKTITSLDTSGYTAPSDGIIVGNCGAANGHGERIIYINGVQYITYGDSVGDYAVPFYLQVKGGDVITCNGAQWGSFKFVPFEYSGVSDINVITPEYIRNQNILSDWEDITISTSSSSPTVMPYDGFIYSATNYAVNLYINTEKFPISDHVDAPGGGACMVAVRKGDKVYIGRDSRDKDLIERVAYYKLRDYTGR